MLTAKIFRASALFLTLLLVGPQPVVAGGQPTLPQIVLEINGKKLLTEVAETPKQRSNGLSYRVGLGADAGMLFVYAAEQPLYFTMQNAGIPLSIAFLSEDWVINEILDMKPFTRGPYPSKKPAMYALEVNQGWFERHNIRAGDTVSYSAAPSDKP